MKGAGLASICSYSFRKRDVYYRKCVEDGERKLYQRAFYVSVKN
jgi:hypothetical protein